MQVNPAKKNLLKKQIPTLLGLGVLVVALIAGVAFISMGGNLSFAPRATAETTPKKIKVTNVSDTSFTVSFFTDDVTAGFVKYGTSADALKSQVGDDRDQLSGSVGEYNLHHVTVRGLTPNTNYYYVLGTGSGSTFDNESAPFSLKTAQKGGAPTAAKTVYGTVLNPNGSPAKEAIVYISIPGANDMSTLVKSSGSWAIPLSNAHASDGSGYAEVSDTTALDILVQGSVQSLTSAVEVSVADAQPVESITLGQDGTSTAASPVPNALPDSVMDGAGVSQASDSANSDSMMAMADDTQVASDSAIGSVMAPENKEVDLEASESGQVVTTTNPKIVGKAKPNVKVMLEIHSDTQIDQQVTADANGNFELDIEQLKQELEPGLHTVTYSYTDPETGEVVNKTVEFTVEADVTQLAMADTTQTTPYGSGNPYSISSPSPSPTTPTATQSATSSATTATDSSQVSTRSAQVATSSSLPKSGAVETTLALIAGGIFFLFAGGWSFYLAKQLETDSRD